MNPHDDGIGLDEYVDWVIEAGYPIQRVDDFGEWLRRFGSGLRALPERQRQHSVLQLLQLLLYSPARLQPGEPTRGALAPTDRFHARCKKPKLAPTTTSHPSGADHPQIHHRLATGRPALARARHPAVSPTQDYFSLRPCCPDAPDVLHEAWCDRPCPHC